MRFLVRARQSRELSEEEQGRFYAAMTRFYEAMPAGVTLECDYVRADRRGSYSVLDVPERSVLDQVLEPFAEFVDLEVVPVLTAREAMGA